MLGYLVEHCISHVPVGETSHSADASHVLLVAMTLHAVRHVACLASHRQSGSEAQPILPVWRSSQLVLQPLPVLLNWHRPLETQAPSLL